MDHKRDRFNCFKKLVLILLIMPSLIYAEQSATTDNAAAKPVVFADDVATADGAAMDSPGPIVKKDPLEKLNRVIFNFNDKVDAWVLRPIASLYNSIIPHPLNRGIHNAFLNLNNIPTVANDVLQFHFQQAANDLWRLGINSTIGIAGLFDVANRVGLPPYSNDFGLTLAHYGYQDSTYLVLPFFGPNTIRDAVSMPIDYYAFSIYPYIRPQSLSYQIYGLGIVDARAQILQFQSVLDEAAVDKYAFQRNAYLQRRAYKIKQNEQLGEKQVNKNVNPEDNASMPGVNIGS